MNKIRLDEFLNIKGISNPTLSKDNKTIAFVVSKPNKENNNYDRYIYVKKENKEILQLTSFGQEGSFTFLDNENIIFGGNRKPKEGEIGSKFYKININGGEATEFLKFKINVASIKPLKNGDFILVGINNLNFPNAKLEKDKKVLEDYKKYNKDNADYEIVNRVPFYMNGQGFLKDYISTLYYYHTKEGKLDELTTLKETVMDFELSKDETKVYYIYTKVKGFMDLEDSNINVINLKTKKVKHLLDKKDVHILGMGVIDNGLYIFGNHDETGINTDPDIYFYNFKDSKLKLVKKFGYSFYNSIGTDIRIGGGNSIKVDEDGTLYFISTIEDGAYLYSYKNNKLNLIIKKDGSVESFDVNNGHIVLVGLYDMKAQELYEYNLKGLKQISKFNDYLKDYYVSKPEFIKFNSVKDEIHGFIYKPINYSPKKKYPVIFDIHGGPKTIYGPVFYHEMQYWTSEGYFVICCNPTGSDGRGRQFADMRGNYGTTDYLDLMNFVDVCLEKYPSMDKKHIYETGGSYGGFMTNWIITHTNRFKACASQRSISNFISFMGTSDIGPIFVPDQVDANNWNNLEKVWDHSPLKYVKNVKTPTLFIHSDEDYRCPLEQALQLFTAIKAKGVDSKLVIFKGENHELSRSGKPTHRIKRLDEITNWFKSHK